MSSAGASNCLDKGKGDASESLAELRKAPTASTAGSLSLGYYAEIAGVMAELDAEIGSFSNNMERLKANVPAQEGLSSLWEEQAKSIRAATRDAIASEGTKNLRSKNKRTQSDEDEGNSSDFDDAVKGQGATNQDDPLLFI